MHVKMSGSHGLLINYRLLLIGLDNSMGFQNLETVCWHCTASWTLWYNCDCVVFSALLRALLSFV